MTDMLDVAVKMILCNWSVSEGVCLTVKKICVQLICICFIMVSEYGFSVYE